jgi:hypothetical protein
VSKVESRDPQFGFMPADTVYLVCVLVLLALRVLRWGGPVSVFANQFCIVPKRRIFVRRAAY